MQTLFVISESVSLSGSHSPLLHIHHQDWTTFHHYSSPIHPPPAYTETRNWHVLLHTDVPKITSIECCEVLATSPNSWFGPLQRCYLSVCRTSAINHFNKACLFGLLDMSVCMDAWEVGGDLLQSIAGVSIGQQWINKYSMHFRFHIRSRNCQGC